MYDALTTLLQRADQQFVCAASPTVSGYDYPYIAHVRHQVTPALSGTEIALMLVQTNHLEQLAVLYSRYGSVRLFCDTQSDASAFYIAPPSEWPALEELLNDWFAELSAAERELLLPEWIDHVAVFGEVPHSGNFFVTPIRGEHFGKVFEFVHDGFEWIEHANDMTTFIDQICTVNQSLILTISQHTRYSDGLTDVQWVPQRYQFKA